VFRLVCGQVIEQLDGLHFENFLSCVIIILLVDCWR